jgi:putative hydrolase of the HAD superfamily
MSFTTKFVFDLDLTLYNEKECTESKNQKVYYNSFKTKPFLNQLLEAIPYKKFILTNATFAHAEDVLARLGIDKHFSKILSTDMVEGALKPSIPIYLSAMKEFGLKPNDNIFFFEDQPDNLHTAKTQFGWTTILLTDRKMKKPKYIDYIFPKIEDALLFFQIKENFKKDNILLSRPIKSPKKKH